MSDVSERSYELLTEADLSRVRDLVVAKLTTVYSGTEVASQYRDRMVCLALCQGAAAHWVGGAHGIKDIDVWAFYRDGLPRPFPYRARWTADLGESRFGRHPEDKGFKGRRIDILGRSIPIRTDEGPAKAVGAWLVSGTKSASMLAQRPLVGLLPVEVFAKTIWLRKS